MKAILCLALAAASVATVRGDPPARAPAQTPGEFASQVAARMESMRDGLSEITSAFYRVRFGGETLAPDDERRLRAVIEQCRKAPVCKA